MSRGKRPTETFVLLLLCKLKYPSSMHLLRGRQECQQVQRIDGFFEAGCDASPSQEGTTEDV